MTVSAHVRHVKPDPVGDTESVPFFDDTRVPIQVIRVPNPAASGLSADQHELVSEKVTYRLAQRTSSYVMLKYAREVIKVKETQALQTRSVAQQPVDQSASLRARAP